MISRTTFLEVLKLTFTRFVLVIKQSGSFKHPARTKNKGINRTNFKGFQVECANIAQVGAGQNLRVVFFVISQPKLICFENKRRKKD